jgi:hypothetical protein
MVWKAPGSDIKYPFLGSFILWRPEDGPRQADSFIDYAQSTLRLFSKSTLKTTFVEKVKWQKSW